MKWFLIGTVGLLCSAGWVRGDAAGDLYNQGATALDAGQYDVAAAAFDKIITGYPNTPNIDDVRLRAGFAYLHQNKFAETIDRLSKETVPTAKPAFRGTALYFTALAQFSMGQQKDATKDASNKAFTQAVATLTDLINYINTAPSPDNKDYLEDAMYYRALAEYRKEDYTSAEKDLQALLQQFTASLKRPDYYQLLGSLYAVETNKAVIAKQPPEAVKALATQALNTFDKIATDPNALVQANDANMSKAEVLYLIAQMDSGSAGYDKALAAFRLIKRKEDMIQLQQKRLDDLKKASQASLQNAQASLANENSRLIERETGRLNELKNGPDPIIQALIRIAECYISMKQSDEARTVIHRLVANATLTTEQQQEVDFQLLYSYVLGGQTDKANRALNDYLAKHAGDPQADSLSYQIAAKLMDRKDYQGALDQLERSLRDFPNGRYIAEVVALKAQALTSMGKVDEAKKVLVEYTSQHKDSPAANQMLLTKAQGELAQRDFDAALADYKTVKDNNSAGSLQAIAAAGYIKTLDSLQRYDEVIAESKAFATKYPTDKSLPSILVFSALAMDKKHDPGAIAALQDVAKKYPTDDTAPFALFYVVNIYQRAPNIPAMIQAAHDLRTAYPNAYAFVAQATDAVGMSYVKDKKFDLAVAEYQPLADAPKPEIAAAARNKIGGVWLAAAKAMGSYQSMQVEVRTEAQKRLTSSEQAYLGTLTNAPDQLEAVGDAFLGLTDVLKLRRSWGLSTDADMEAYFGKITAGLTSPEMQARVEMAKAGLVFIYKGGDKQYPAALDRYKKIVSANANLPLTRQEANQYGELLLAAKDYAGALQVYTDLQNKSLANDQLAQADADYGLGATYLAQGNVAKAKEYFSKMKALPNGAAWHPHISDADFGLALANEQSNQGADNTAAMQTYAQLMQSNQASVAVRAKSMLGYGRLLEKAGHAIAPATPGTIEFAVHYYQEADAIYGPAVPGVSAEGLYDAGQAYDKAGDKANAQAQYKKLLDTYSKTAPDWAAKAQAAMGK